MMHFQDYSKLALNKSAPQPGVHRAPRIPTCLQRNRAARRVPAAFTTLADDSDSDSSSSDSSVELSQSDRDEIARIRRRRMEEKGLPLYERGFKEHRVRQSRSPSPAKVAPKIYEGSETVFDGCRQSGFQRKTVVYSSTSESEEEDKSEVLNKPKETQLQPEVELEPNPEVKPEPEQKRKLSNTEINAPDMNQNYKKLRGGEEQASFTSKTLNPDQKSREAQKTSMSIFPEPKSDSKSQTKATELKPEAKTVSKPEPKTVPEPEPKAVPKPESKTVPKPESKTVPKPERKTVLKSQPEPESNNKLSSTSEQSRKSPSGKLHDNEPAKRSLVTTPENPENAGKKSAEASRKSKSEKLASETDILFRSTETKICSSDNADTQSKPNLEETAKTTIDDLSKKGSRLVSGSKEATTEPIVIEVKSETKIEPEENSIRSIPKTQDKAKGGATNDKESDKKAETKKETKPETKPNGNKLKSDIKMAAAKEDLPEDAEQKIPEKDGKSIRAVLEKDAQSVRSELELTPSIKSPSDEAINCRTEIDRQIEDDACQTPSTQSFSEKKKASKKEKIELPDEEQYEPFEPEEAIFALKSFEYLFMWEWDVENETCAICRSSLMEVSPTNPVRSRLF